MNTETSLADLLAPYPVQTSVPVQWGEMDAAGHVNNAVYLRWFESGRIDYFRELGIMLDYTGADPVSAILGKQECTYLLPMRWPDTAIVGSRILRVGADRFWMEHAVFSEQYERLAAIGLARIVAFDYSQHLKTELPETARAKIIALEARIGNAVEEVG